MVLAGIIRNGTIVLDQPAPLPAIYLFKRVEPEYVRAIKFSIHYHDPSALLG